MPNKENNKSDQTKISKLLRLMKLLTGNVSRTIDSLAKEMGVPGNHTVIAGLGEVIELTGKTIRKNGEIPSGRVGELVMDAFST